MTFSVGDFFRWRFLQRYESASNISNCRQHKLSSTSITNTDVTLSMQTQCEEGAKYNGLVSIYHQILPIDAPSIVRQWWSTCVNQELRAHAIQLGNARFIVWHIVSIRVAISPNSVTKFCAILPKIAAQSHLLQVVAISQEFVLRYCDSSKTAKIELNRF